MANRHLARSTVLQTLYEWDFGEKKSNTKEILDRDMAEFAPDSNDRTFMQRLLVGVTSKFQDLDVIIEKAAPDWPIDKISVMDRNILRLGLYELLFSDRAEVPPKVAINEAIELGKTFGSESSSKFINGVLGAVYREMGEPGKDDKALPKKPIPLEALAGAVVYARKDNDVYLCLVHDVFGHWTLSKGHIEASLDIKLELKRAIKEEIGIDVKPSEHLGHTEYGTFDPEKGKIKKRVEYYLAETEYADVRLKSSGGLDDAQWFRLADILDLNFYDDILPIVTKAIDILVKSP
ncbi:MAG TPA: transcription antitermination factor NusB [Candidatus Paceibacterota bacterium]